MARVAVREKKSDYPALRRGVVRCMIDRTCISSSRARDMYGKRRLHIEARDTVRRVRRTPRRRVVGRHARGCRARPGGDNSRGVRAYRAWARYW